jgi:protein SCO1/2
MKAKSLFIVAMLIIATGALMVYARGKLARGTKMAEAAASRSAAGALEPLWPAPEFSYSDEQGQAVTARSLRGKVWVANFIFTQCRTVCPMLTSKMTMLMRRLEGINARFVSFSVDPAHDTPQVLLHYKHKWAADEPRWSLLATDALTLPEVAKGFRITAQKSDQDGGHDPIIHSSIFAVVDAHGLVRGVFDSEHARDFEALQQAVVRLTTSAIATPTPKAEPTPEQLYQDLKCAQCHDAPALAPTLGGRAGKRSELANGLLADYDEAYIRESLLAPDAKRVRGYPLHMPSYDGLIEGPTLTAMTQWLLVLPASAAAPAAEAQVETDVVCGMSVRVVDDTPRAAHAGRAFYFCAEDCKGRFLASPSTYTTKKP